MSRFSNSRVRSLTASVLLVLLVLGVVVSGVLLTRQGSATDKPLSIGNSGSVIPSDRDVAAVKAVGEQFALRIDAITPADIPGYVKRVGELMTTKYRSDFEKAQPLLVAKYAKTKFTAQGYVRSIGITSQDQDSAVILIAHDSLLTPSSGDPERSAYRWTVTLRKVDGKWLVDDFVDPDRTGQAE
ncbi:MAG: hypothetical protein JWQ74_2046 [Marmoricola sp.]|nr:hypothetical protein [Marmoricola sp.]